MDKEEILKKANVQRAFVATIMQALNYYIDDMVNYCKDNKIAITPYEKNQINIMRKAIKSITIDYRTLSKNKGKAFINYSKIVAVTIQELFSRTDNDYMTMYKFYNYIKAFPNQNHYIDVPYELEKDAFSVIFNNDNNDDNRT